MSRWCAATLPICAPKVIGGWKQYDQANEEFRIATAAPDSDPLYKVRWGMLLHQRFNNTDAVALFQEALQKDPKNAQAYLGLSRLSARTDLTVRPRSMSAGPWYLIPSWWRRMNSLPTWPWKTRTQNTHSLRLMRRSRLSPDALNAMAIHARSSCCRTALPTRGWTRYAK